MHPRNSIQLAIGVMVSTALASASAADDLGPRRSVSERLVTGVVALKADSWALSADGNRLAQIVKAGKMFHVEIDGKKDPDYLAVASPTFSSDGKRFAYVARSKEGAFAVVDGRPGKVYPNIHHLSFSPDGRRVAYAYAFLGGVAGGGTVVDGSTYPQLGYRFHPDGASVVLGTYAKQLYAAGQVLLAGGSDPLVVLSADGEPRTIAAKALGAFFSPDGKRIAFHECDSRPSASRGRDWLRCSLNVDGATKDQASDRKAEPVFSPDSQHLASVTVVSDKQEALVVDGAQVGPLATFIKPLAFSPDGKRLAYWAHGIPGEGRSDAPVRVLELQDLPAETKAGSSAYWPEALFSPNSQRIAVTKHNGYNTFMIVDGREGGLWTSLSWAGPPVFSADSRYVANSAERKGKHVVVINGRYEALAGAREYEWVAPDSLSFPSPNQLRYLALKADGVYEVLEVLDAASRSE